MWDDALVFVMVDAAYDMAGEARGKVAGEGVVVDEEPAGVLWGEVLFWKVREGDEVVGLEAGRTENCVELRAEGEVRAGKVGEGNVQVVWRGVGAEVGVEQGRAKGVEIW
jgi:hypothetical protein